MPSTARTTPSSLANCTREVADRRAGSAAFRSSGSQSVGVGRIAQPVAEKLKARTTTITGSAGRSAARAPGQRLDVLRVLQQHAPADRRRPQAEAEED